MNNLFGTHEINKYDQNQSDNSSTSVMVNLKLLTALCVQYLSIISQQTDRKAESYMERETAEYWITEQTVEHCFFLSVGDAMVFSSHLLALFRIDQHLLTLG